MAPALQQALTSPTGVATDAQGNIYVSDNQNNAIRKITPAGVVTTLAGGTYGSGNGTGTAASFENPTGVATDALGNVYVTDYQDHLVREITPAGVVTTLAGSAGNQGQANGIGTAATFGLLTGVTTDGLGNLYVTDTGYSTIRKIIITGYSISPALPSGLNFDATAGTISGTPTASSAATNYSITAYNTGGSSTATVNITVNTSLPAPNISYAGPQTYTTGTAITSLTPTNSGGAVPATIYTQVGTLAGSGTQGAVNGTGTAASFYNPIGVASDASGNLYIADTFNHIVRKITSAGVVTTLAAGFTSPVGIAVDASGNVYITDQGNNVVDEISPAGVVTTVAGSGAQGSTNGTGTAATFNNPHGIAVDGFGNLYVADYGNLIRKIAPGGVVTTLAGSGSQGSSNGQGTAASFYLPCEVAVDGAGNVYVADQGNQLIRKISPAGLVTTLAGSGSGQSVDGVGTAASFDSPSGITVDATGNVYVTDEGSYLIRKITPAGVVTTIAGTGSMGSANGIGTSASFYLPQGACVDNLGNLYISDSANNLIRKIAVTGYTITPALPAGLSFDSTTGIISGTPTASSTATTYSITAYNTGGSSTATVSITVNSAPAPKVFYVGPQKYTVNTIITPLIPSVTGGIIPEATFAQDTSIVKDGATADSARAVVGAGTQFSRYKENGTTYLTRKTMVTGYVISPDLPAGLFLDNSTGKISGTPVANIPATDFTITAVNPLGNSVAHLVITVSSLDVNGNIVKTGIGPLQVAIDTTTPAPLVHQALSPNGDGKDDFLMIENISSYPDNKITLVDRNGVLVYRTEGYDNTNKLFDGHSNITGAMQKQGTYFYILEYVDANGKSKRQTGFFVLKY